MDYEDQTFQFIYNLAATLLFFLDQAEASSLIDLKLKSSELEEILGKIKEKHSRDKATGLLVKILSSMMADENYQRPSLKILEIISKYLMEILVSYFLFFLKVKVYFKKKQGFSCS